MPQTASQTAPQTVVLTGASGFIAKHILLRLLQRGHTVRAGLRSPARAAEVRDAVAPHVAPDALGRLSFVTLDLDRDDGWAAAMAGADALMHTASPFPLVQPKNADDLVRPAVDGTLRALRAAAAAGANRVIVTASSVCITNTDLPPGKTLYDETVWSDPGYRTINPYGLSKLKAEQAAWDFARSHPAMRLTTINPVLVAGPPLDAHYGTSLRVVERILKAKDPAVPPISFGVVDVRDVAEAHLRALERPDTAGERILCYDDTLWFRDMAQAMQDALPGRRIVTRTAPGWFLRILGLFDPAIGTVLPMLHRFERMDNAKARRLLGMTFTPAREAVVASARWMVENGRA